MADQRLFISHANEDSAVVNLIVRYLEAHGVPCWIAGRDIPPQAIYAEAITSAIQSASACAVIVSNASNGSAAIKRELELASHHGRPFIPIRIDGAEPGPGFDYYLRNTQWIDYQREQERGLDRIVAHLKGADVSGRANKAPPPPQPRAVRGNLMPALLLGAALIIGGGAAWYLLRPTSTHETAATADVAPVSTAPPVQVVDVNGAWNLSMTCANGASLAEPEAVFQDASYQRQFAHASASGETRLRLTSSDMQSIHLTGEIAFAGGTVMPVDAQASTNDHGATFTGFGLYGTNQNCPFVATRLR